MIEYLSDILQIIILVILAIMALLVIVILCIPVKQQRSMSNPVKALKCSVCGTDMMSENYGCVKCKMRWCKGCIEYCRDGYNPGLKADWVLQDGLSDMCVGCRPKREMTLPKPVCFNCEKSIDKKTLQCKACYRTYCKHCKYTSLNATNDGCTMCTPLDEKWQRKSSAKAICVSCDHSYDELYQCDKCMRTYCKHCNYKINNDTCWDCVIVI